MERSRGTQQRTRPGVERKRSTKEQSGTEKLVNQIESNSNRPVIKNKIDTSVLIPSGLAMLNCACSDNAFGAFALGQVVTVPGASQGGKTILMLNMLASICLDPRFNDYGLIYDDGEETVERFDIPYLFGEDLASRLKAPAYDEDIPLHSNTIQDGKANILSHIDGKQKVIYILDSLDSLTTDEEIEREFKKLLAQAKDDAEALKQLKGSYKMEKAKAIGEALRMITQKLKLSKSALFIVQQVRQKIGATKFERQWITSGGNAPFFYSVHQIYMAPGEQIKPEIKKLKLKIGNRCRLQLIKNKLTGKERTVKVDIYNDYGMDDIGSCVEFLIKAKAWSQNGGWINPDGIFTKKYQRQELLKAIAREGAIKELHELTGKTWLEVEELFRIDRPRRF